MRENLKSRNITWNFHCTFCSHKFWPIFYVGYLMTQYWDYIMLTRPMLIQYLVHLKYLSSFCNICGHILVCFCSCDSTLSLLPSTRFCYQWRRCKLKIFLFISNTAIFFNTLFQLYYLSFKTFLAKHNTGFWIRLMW